MLNPKTGIDEAKYFSLVVAVSLATRSRVRAAALKRLERAVREEAKARAVCRDVDAMAATRVRAWTPVA